MANRDAADYRRIYHDISGHLDLAAATGDTTLVTSRGTGWTIYIQRVIGYVTTDAAQNLSFEDSNTSARKIAEITTSPGDETRWDFYFGDIGVPLNSAKNFLANVSAAGLAGQIVWEGYERQTGTISVAGG